MVPENFADGSHKKRDKTSGDFLPDSKVEGAEDIYLVLFNKIKKIKNSFYIGTDEKCELNIKEFLEIENKTAKEMIPFQIKIIYQKNGIYFLNLMETNNVYINLKSLPKGAFVKLNFKDKIQINNYKGIILSEIPLTLEDPQNKKKILDVKKKDEVYKDIKIKFSTIVEKKKDIKYFSFQFANNLLKKIMDLIPFFNSKEKKLKELKKEELEQNETIKEELKKEELKTTSEKKDSIKGIRAKFQIILNKLSAIIDKILKKDKESINLKIKIKFIEIFKNFLKKFIPPFKLKNNKNVNPQKLKTFYAIGIIPRLIALTTDLSLSYFLFKIAENLIPDDLKNIHEETRKYLQFILEEFHPYPSLIFGKLKELQLTMNPQSFTSILFFYTGLGLLGNILFGVTFGDFCCSIRGARAFLSNRIGGIIRFLLSIITAPLFFLLDAPCFFHRRTFKEIITFNPYIKNKSGIRIFTYSIIPMIWILPLFIPMVLDLKNFDFQGKEMDIILSHQGAPLTANNLYHINKFKIAIPIEKILSKKIIILPRFIEYKNRYQINLKFLDLVNNYQIIIGISDNFINEKFSTIESNNPTFPIFYPQIDQMLIERSQNFDAIKANREWKNYIESTLNFSLYEIDKFLYQHGLFFEAPFQIRTKLRKFFNIINFSEIEVSSKKNISFLHKSLISQSAVNYFIPIDLDSIYANRPIYNFQIRPYQNPNEQNQIPMRPKILIDQFFEHTSFDSNPFKNIVNDDEYSEVDKYFLNLLKIFDSFSDNDEITFDKLRYITMTYLTLIENLLTDPNSKELLNNSFFRNEFISAINNAKILTQNSTLIASEKRKMIHSYEKYLNKIKDKF